MTSYLHAVTHTCGVEFKYCRHVDCFFQQAFHAKFIWYFLSPEAIDCGPAYRLSDLAIRSNVGFFPVDILCQTHAVYRTRPQPFYALIIGISEYASPSVNNLKSAVRDALSVKQYLEEDLGVPKSHIRLLFNAEATRAGIIQEFKNLVADRRIHRGDPILIFYAGHGGEVGAPKGWEAGNAKIQMLIPHDFRTTVGGREIYGIPDRTIGTLLSRIAEKWDDNIVCMAKNDYVYATDKIMGSDSHLRLLPLWICHT